MSPDHKDIKESSFDLVFDTVGLEVSRQQAISVVKPGGIIVHIGLTCRRIFNLESNPSGSHFYWNYCYTNKEFGETIDILTDNKLGKIEWIEYRNLKEGGEL